MSFIIFATVVATIILFFRFLSTKEAFETCDCDECRELEPMPTKERLVILFWAVGLFFSFVGFVGWFVRLMQ